MILPDACRVNIQPARKACSINAESLLNLSGIHAQFRRFGCAISVVYALITTFDPMTYHILVERMTVYSKDKVIVQFKNGMEIQA